MFNKSLASSFSIPLTIAYTYTKATFDETFVNGGGDWGTGKINKGDMIPFITPHLLTSSIGFEGKKLNVTLLGRYLGPTRIKPGQGEFTFPEQSIKYNDVDAINSFMIFDLSANYRIFENTSIYATVNNLTNNKAIVANLPNGYRPNIPLSYNIGLKVDF